MRANGQTENKVASLAFKSDEGPRFREKRRDEAKRMRFGSEYPVGFRRQVARQVHGVVKDAKNLDHTTRRGAIHGRNAVRDGSYVRREAFACPPA
jgi:hypothetical protein